MSYLITSISNSGGAPEQAYRKLQNAGACPSAPHAEMFKLEVPSLMVGTLDSLMNLSDELGKTDSLIEAIVRKVEKSSAELAGKKFSAAELTVGGVPSTRYIQQFAWDYAKYPNRRPLKELVSLISSGVAAIDEELKQLSASYGDKTVALQDAKRKKGGNLLVADLNDALDEKTVRSLDIHDTEYLKTIFVAVGKGQVEQFQKEIYGLGGELVGYGGSSQFYNIFFTRHSVFVIDSIVFCAHVFELFYFTQTGPDWSRNPDGLGQNTSYGSSVDRHKTKGSPVVPGSLHKVTSDNESTLFMVTILRGMYEVGIF